MLNQHSQLSLKVQERLFCGSFETHQKLRLKQRRMRQISLAAVLGFGPQKLKTAALNGRFGWVSRDKMQVLHAVAQLIDVSD